MNIETEREYPFEFSVVMAVYNVEPFLREAVDSLIAQDFGFENIQLIMVDDGSKDGSGAICDEYAAQYPDNVVVIHKENGGAASARNEGLKYATGHYLNFMDSDDKLEKNVMSEVYTFFIKHEEETDVVVIPLMFFDGQSGQHMLNYKFKKGSRVIDLYKEYSMIQLSMSAAFICHDALAGRYFDERLCFAEDAKCLMGILTEKMTLGVLKEQSASYLYRKRTGGTPSAIQSSGKIKSWYIPYLSFFCEDVINDCLKKFEYIPKFIQYTIAYDLQWRVKRETISDGLLDSNMESLYFSKLTSLFQYIDDSIIMDQKNIFPEHKLFMLRKKYERLPTLVKRYHDALLCFHNTAFFSLSRCQLYLEFLELNADKCSIEGYTGMFPIQQESVSIEAEVNGQVYPCEIIERRKPRCALGEVILQYYGFRVDIPLISDIETQEVKFFVVIDGLRVENNNLKFGQFFPVGELYKNSYYFKGGWRVSVSKSQVRIASCTVREHLRSEFAFCRELWRENRIGSRKAILARFIYHVLSRLKRKEIWLVSDRIMKADDNGEAFFHYLQNDPQKQIKSYFVLSKKSVDYERIQQVGSTIDALSFKHKLLHLLCDYNISSHADAITINPFNGYHDSYRDILVKPRYIFLQHGITKDDISGWLNRYNKNISGFITAAVPEYQSILNGNYSYTENEVWLTGFPRFDRLYCDEKKYITFMPTWREYLMQGIDTKTGIWRLGDKFQESAFFQFYNGILNSERLLQTAQDLNYQIQFMPHPTLQPHISVFTQDERVRFLDMRAKYRDIYAQSDLIVTDYSSAVFDFSYLRKPIIYCHFDAQEFFSGKHVYTKGYFDYERDGFGEVEYDLESTVDRIIEYMKNGCQLKEQYRERIDRFFAFNDRNNCQRVYEEILKLNKQE